MTTEVKLELKDIEIKNVNKYIKWYIINKFGSIESFGEAIKMSPSTIAKYLKGKHANYTDNFKARLTKALDISYSDLALNESQQIAKYVNEVFDNIELYSDNSDLALLERLYTLCMNNDMTIYTSKMYRNLSKYYFFKSDCRIAIHYISQALNLIDDIHDNANMLNLRVCYLSELILIYIYDKSYDLARDAIRSIENKLKDTNLINDIENRNLFWYYYRKGILFNNTGKSSIALESFQKALSYNYDNLTFGKAKMNIGIALKKQGKYDEALNYYDEALSKFDKSIDIGILLNNKAEVYRLLGNYRIAKEYILSSFDMISPDDIATNVIVYETYLQIVKDSGEDINEAILKLIQILKQCIDNNCFIHRKFITASIENTIAIIYSSKNMFLLDKISGEIFEMIKVTKDEVLRKELYTCYGIIKYYQEEMKEV